MKKNNKGFMLVEVIVTSVVIVTTMIGLYSIFNGLYISYESKGSYYNIDSIYATKSMVNYLMDNNFNDFVNKVFSSSQSKVLINSDGCDTEFLNNGVCNKLRDFYSINSMIIAEYDSSVLEKDIKAYGINQTFVEYIDYVVDYYDVSNNETKYSYIILTEIKNGNSNYYANIGIE